jgi:hypothetical protein
VKVKLTGTKLVARVASSSRLMNFRSKLLQILIYIRYYRTVGIIAVEESVVFAVQGITALGLVASIKIAVGLSNFGG